MPLEGLETAAKMYGEEPFLLSATITLTTELPTSIPVMMFLPIFLNL
jgi:hypothetical protein